MKKLLLSILLILSISVYSQKEANIWYFGANAGLDFNTTPPTALTDGQINTLEGCSSFSDADGNLLFYSDGITVYDKNHQVMNYSNGNPANNLTGNPSSTQSGMIIPKPGSSSIYYLFTVGDNNFPAFDYYVIDMNLNSGAGELIDEKGNGFVTNLTGGRSNWTEKVAAVRGKECNTFWVVSIVGFDFFAYKVDDKGVANTPIISPVANFSANRGYLKLSPDGSKLAIANQDNDAFLYSFNNETGVVQNDGIPLINNTFSDGQPYGVEFSPDSKKVYISTVSNFRNELIDPAVTYKLFQFDLNAADITNSKTSIYTQSPANSSEGGFRGALQLGPDGKIYATIPVAYSDPNGFAEFLDVIENPNDNASDIVFTKNAINLNGRRATQGLPPFIASLLLPIEIKDQISSEVVNNQTLQFCVGNSKTIAPDPVTGNNVDYLWTFDNGTTTSTVSNTINLSINNMSLSDAGTYNLKVTLADDCGNKIEQQAKFNLEVYQPSSSTQPLDIFFCDVDNDGFNSFNLQTDVTPQILNGQDPAVFEVVYYLSQADADNNTTANAIANPYTNPTAFSNQTIYARMHNIAAPNACYDVKSFTLAITGKPVPQAPTSYEACDDALAGGDTDGFFNNFLLNTKDAQILGALSTNLYEVSYHTTLVGAQTDNSTDVIDKDTPYRNTNANSQTIFVRVENKNNAACNDTSKSFNLVINPLPVINNIVELKQCDNDTDAFADFNLEEARSNISANYLNETFVFYPTLTDAQNNTAPITNPTVFPNRTVTSDIVWARAITNNGCYRISQVNLTVSTTGIPASFQRSFTQCDDFLDIDGNNNTNNSDTDGVTSFNFSSVDSEIKALFPAVGQQINVTYYRNEADALAEINKIIDISNYRNIGYPNTQQIYVRVDSDLDNDCLGFGAHITLNVNTVPIANNVANFELCDDFDSGAFDDGINNNINLRNRVNDILGGAQTSANFTVTFYTSAADANSDTNPIINDTNYTNQTRDRETIYVRVLNNTTGCFNDHLTFDIIINPLPTITKPIPDIEVCDDGTDGSSINGLAQNINLSQRDEDVLDGRDENDFTVSYHKTRQQAIDGTSPVNKMYSNDPTRTIPPVGTAIDAPHKERLWISILNNDTQCRYGIATVTIVTYPEPILPVNITNYEACDNTSDAANSDTNGINGDISLSTKISEILANYPASEHGNFKVTFHDELVDAQTGDDPINENQYENTISNQPIYVRVQNIKTNCVNDNLSFNIVINPLPEFIVDPQVIVCLGEHVRLEALNPLAEYNYQWYKDGAPTNILSTDIFYNATEGGTYVVKATMKGTTGCERELGIVVDESIKPTLNDDDIVIVDDTNNSGLDTYSIKIITENQNLGIGNYQFALEYIDNNGFNIQTPFQDEPLFENILGGFYTVVVNDKNGCQPDAKLEVSVIEYPKFLTPNGDGKNDTWKIKGANSSFYPSSNITVVNRHGKIVAIIPIDSDGWNGTYNGKTLPSSDYWFRIQLVDRKGKVHQHQGHFALIRR